MQTEESFRCGKSCQSIELTTQLLNYKHRFDMVLKAAKICVFEVDLVRQLYTIFENSEDIFGVSGEKILQDVQPFSQLPPEAYQQAVTEYFSHPADADVIDEAFRRILTGNSVTYQARMKAGATKYIWCKLDVTPVMENGVPVRMIGVITDINQMKSQTDALQQKIKLDGFTGLYSKKYAQELMDEVLRQKCSQTHALLLIDLDNFKAVNDTYGHIAGDQVLKEISECIKKTLRKTDIQGRFGGDEFILLLQNVGSAQLAKAKAQVLLFAQDNAYHVTKSIGIALYPQDATDFETLFAKADRALYYSKKEKNTATLYEEIPPQEK